jgi:hypothetical protein
MTTSLRKPLPANQEAWDRTVQQRELSSLQGCLKYELHLANVLNRRYKASCQTLIKGVRNSEYLPLDGATRWLSGSGDRSPLRGIGFLVKKELRNLMTVCIYPIEHDPSCSGETFWMLCWFRMSARYLHLHCLCTWTSTRQQSCRSFYALLTEQCVHPSALGDITLLGNFNARIGQISW